MTRIIHTSDWHLGHRLEGQERAREQQAFLDWLQAELRERAVEALVVCGDIFDVANPPIDAVRMLYAFLAEASRHCPNIVLVGGNHDSGARLDAMAPLAEALGITIVGSLPRDRSQCVVPLARSDGQVFATLAAVPYLRAGDLTAALPNEDAATRHSRVLDSIRACYDDILATVPDTAPRPLLVTGHLFARGGIETSGERATHVEAGQLLGVTPDVFGDRAAYVALGHLHRHQPVRRTPPIWYSGTPVPLSFAEANQEQQVMVLDIDESDRVSVDAVAVPRAVGLYDLEGEGAEVLDDLARLVADHPEDGPPGWVRVTVKEREPDPTVREAIAEAVAASSLTVLAVRRQVVGERQGLADTMPQQRLEEMTPEAVFEVLYRQRYDAAPEDALVDAFAAVLEEVREQEGSA